MNNQQDNKNKSLEAIALGSQLGLAIAVSLVVFLLVGVWLDKKFGTMPLFTIISVILSMVAVVLQVRYIILPILEKRSRNNKDK